MSIERRAETDLPSEILDSLNSLIESGHLSEDDVLGIVDELFDSEDPDGDVSGAVLGALIEQGLEENEAMLVMAGAGLLEQD